MIVQKMVISFVTVLKVEHWASEVITTEFLELGHCAALLTTSCVMLHFRILGSVVESEALTCSPGSAQSGSLPATDSGSWRNRWWRCRRFGGETQTFTCVRHVTIAGRMVRWGGGMCWMGERMTYIFVFCSRFTCSGETERGWSSVDSRATRSVRVVCCELRSCIHQKNQTKPFFFFYWTYCLWKDETLRETLATIDKL